MRIHHVTLTRHNAFRRNLDVGEWGQYAPIIAKMAYQSVISKATTALKMVGEPEDEIVFLMINAYIWMFCKDNLLTCYYYVQSSACQSTIHGPMNSEQPFLGVYQKTTFDLHQGVDLDIIYLVKQ